VIDDFRHRTSLQVRFRDIDAFGHVNNAVFGSYVEQARVTYLLDVLDIDGPFSRLPLILARLEIDFRTPILFGEEIVVASRVVRIGRTSFAMQHEVRAGADQHLAAEVSSVLVCFDYTTSRPTRVPDAWRTAMIRHEGHPLDTDAPRAASAAAAR